MANPEKTEGAIKNGQSSETDNIGYIRYKTNTNKAKTQHNMCSFGIIKQKLPSYEVNIKLSASNYSPRDDNFHCSPSMNSIIVYCLHERCCFPESLALDEATHERCCFPESLPLDETTHERCCFPENLVLDETNL